ncbi:MAG TPA: choice-of-anchor tandem repeat GloVer-containing protein, partial [Chitinophagaceae bacterium]|nr:choice-of-anchor tandem repeat GloVer-containing protein [Chitinophagaceae bacterium]
MKKYFFSPSCLLMFFSALQAQPSFLGLTETGAGFGTISRYDAGANTITAVHSFQVKGLTPCGKLLKVVDGKFYGMTRQGGTSNYGVIFSFDPISSSYSVLKNFDNITGGYPMGSLIQAGDGKLYGMTQQGGALGYGVIFSFDPVSYSYAAIKNFDNATGGFPYGSLIQATDGKLYGMTYQGGTSNYGVIFSFDPLSSSYTVLKNFDNSTGAYPYSSLIQATDGKLYGTTISGGTSGYGVMFSLDPAFATYSVIKNFNYSTGGNPYGSLMQANNGKLYGTTQYGGTTGYGVIYSFDPLSANYSVVKNFDYSTGGYPYGSLMQAPDGRLYGMTQYGGTVGYGVIFSFDFITSSYNVVKNFDYTNGGYPFLDELTENNDGKLYGATLSGGVSGWGVIFSLDLSSNTYNKLFDFGSNDGFYPEGSLCKATNGNYYGVTSQGGQFGYGVIFSFDPVSSNYNVLKNFDNTNGTYPRSSLIRASDGKLYGMTQQGGTLGYGVIFSFDPASTAYSILKNFDNANGAYPFGSLMQASDGKLYGMTVQGGASGLGVLFSLDPASLSYNVLKNFDNSTGAYPYGSLISGTDGKLYGVISSGGSFGYGVIFSFDPVNSSYNVVKNFDNTNGGNPYGSLLQLSNGKLYGMAAGGGSSGYGVIYTFDPATSSYNVVKNFDNTNGAFPYGSLTKASDGKLYGMTRQGGTGNYGVIFSFDPSTAAYAKQDFNYSNGAYQFLNDLIEITTCNPITVTATVTNNPTGPLLPQTMNFGAGGDVTFVGQGPGAKQPGGKTNIYSAISTSTYNGLWWTFTPIENPRHSSQSPTGNMQFSGYDPSTGIITFTSTVNMIWPATGGTENIATRMRIQLQPYTGTHNGQLASGWITPVTAGDISLTSLPSTYPLIDIKTLGSPAAFQVWYIVETSAGIPLDQYYGTVPHNSTIGGQTVTSFTGTFFSSTLSTCNGGPASVSVTATGGTEPYTGTGVFSANAGQHTYTVTDANGCNGSATIDAEPQNCIDLQCVGDKTVNTDAGVCIATVTNIDAIISPANAIVHYKIKKEGEELESGTGSVSGKTFGKGITTVTYTSADEPTKTCSFTITVEDKEKPKVITKNITVQLDGNGSATITPLQIDNGSSDNCVIAVNGYSLDQATFDCSHLGQNTVTLTVTDADGNSNSKTATVTVEDNVKPTVFTQNITVQLDATGSATITPLQIDNGSYDNCSIAESGYSLNKMTFNCTDVGTNTVTLTVTDVNGNSDSKTATVTVEDKIKPTVFTQNITVQLDRYGSATIIPSQIDNSSTDNCSIPTSGYSLSKTSFDCSNVGQNTVTLTVTDVNGNSNSKSATVAVQDKIKPTVVTQNITVQLDASGSATITPSQIDNGSYDNCSIPANGYSLDKTIFNCSNIGTNTVTLTVTDVNGNSDGETATVTVQDNIKPTVITQNITVQLNSSGMATIVASQIDNSSYDNCSIPINGYSLDKTVFNCANVGSNAVTLTVTDVNGNSNSKTATVTVQDNIKPTVITQNITLQLNVAGSATINASQINNGSFDNCAITVSGYSLSKATFSCSDVGQNTVTLTVTDVNGNSDSKTAIVTVQDNTKPIASCRNITACLGLDGTVAITPLQIDNGSSDACGVSLSLDKTSFNTSNVGDNTVTLTVTDPSGNSSSCTATVTVKKRPTVLVYKGDGSEQYSDQQLLTAELRDQLTNTVLNSKLVSFNVGSQSTSGTTNASGIASANLMLAQDPTPTYTIKSSFAGDAIFSASNDEDAFDILQEDARAYYTGTLFASTGSGSTTTLTLSATIRDISAETGDPTTDPYAGDIRNAKVTFIDRSTNTAIATVPIGLVNLADPKTGTATYTWNVNIGTANSQDYTIGIVVNNYYTRNSSAENTVVTVSKSLD